MRENNFYERYIYKKAEVLNCFGFFMDLIIVAGTDCKSALSGFLFGKNLQKPWLTTLSDVVNDVVDVKIYAT